MYNGIINIYKEPGFTSFDVIAKLRGILHQKKIGHTGTLDPEATGVLPVCLGNATKVCELIMDHEKVYEALLVLGISTDTQDFSGSIISENAAAFSLSDEKIEKAVKGFVGEYEQLPPMYSAKKVNGKHLYELAREGKEIERKKCHVKISEIDILDSGYGELPVKEHLIAGNVTRNEQQDCAGSGNLNLNDSGNEKSYLDITAKYRWLRIKVTCSKGTYIRTLCQDIGDSLKVGGCMAELKRTKVGPFEIKDAVTLSQVCEISKASQKSGQDTVNTGTENDSTVKNITEAFGADISIIKSVDSLFMDYPAVGVKPEGMKALLNGNSLHWDGLKTDASSDKEMSFPDNTRVRVYDEKGNFKAIYSYMEAEQCFKAVKMFL